MADFQREFPDARVVALDLEREMLSDSSINASLEICGRPVTVSPDIYVKDHETLIRR